jgi:hypothetical protein
MLTLTPLADIDVFDEATRNALADYWITTAEEFATTARTSNQQYGTGLGALVQMLGTSEEHVNMLVQAARAALPLEATFGVGAQPELGTGAIFEQMAFYRETSFDIPLQLPTEVNLISRLPLPLQQGKRDTCLAFAVVALYQHATGDLSDLSEQFVYWASKERDGMPNTSGTRPDVALEVLRDMGVCTEALWPYESRSIAGNEGQGPPPEGAAEEARLRRILAFSCLANRNYRQIKAALADGTLVLVGLPIYEHWKNAWQARVLGRVRQPLPGEAERGGHAMVVVGYRDDPTVPGGGYFIVRNSWGISWGAQNLDGPGHCHIPYRVMAEHNLVSCVVEDVLPPPAPASATSVANIPESNSTAVPVFQPPEADPIHVEIQALYEEARDIRDQINALVERLAILMQRTRSDR